MCLREFLEIFATETEIVVLNENGAIIFQGLAGDLPLRICRCREILPEGTYVRDDHIIIETKGC